MPRLLPARAACRGRRTCVSDRYGRSGFTVAGWDWEDRLQGVQWGQLYNQCRNIHIYSIWQQWEQDAFTDRARLWVHRGYHADQYWGQWRLHLVHHWHAHCWQHLCACATPHMNVCMYIETYRHAVGSTCVREPRHTCVYVCIYVYRDVQARCWQHTCVHTRVCICVCMCVIVSVPHVCVPVVSVLIPLSHTDHYSDWTKSNGSLVPFQPLSDLA